MQSSWGKIGAQRSSTTLPKSHSKSRAKPDSPTSLSDSVPHYSMARIRTTFPRTQSQPQAHLQSGMNSHVKALNFISLIPKDTCTKMQILPFKCIFSFCELHGWQFLIKCCSSRSDEEDEGHWLLVAGRACCWLWLWTVLGRCRPSLPTELAAVRWGHLESVTQGSVGTDSV